MANWYAEKVGRQTGMLKKSANWPSSNWYAEKVGTDWLSTNWHAEKVGRLVVDKLACRKSRQTGKSHIPAGALLNFHTAVILRRLVTAIESDRDLGVLATPTVQSVQLA